MGLTADSADRPWLWSSFPLVRMVYLFGLVLLLFVQLDPIRRPVGTIAFTYFVIILIDNVDRPRAVGPPFPSPGSRPSWRGWATSFIYLISRGLHDAIENPWLSITMPRAATAATSKCSPGLDARCTTPSASAAIVTCFPSQAGRHFSDHGKRESHPSRSSRISSTRCPSRRRSSDRSLRLLGRCLRRMATMCRAASPHDSVDVYVPGCAAKPESILDGVVACARRRSSPRKRP